MELIKFHPDHIRKMAEENPDYEILLRIVDYSNLNGLSYTLISNEGIIGSGGVDLIMPGVGEAWTVLGKIFYKYRFSAHKVVLQSLKDAERQYNLRRIQASCVKGFEKAEKWLKALGFEYEGVMRKFGPDGNDFLRYARIN